MRYFFFSLFFLLFNGFVATAQLPDGFIREAVATGLNPTSMVQSPDGRIFITEKNGLIRVISDGNLLDEPLLNLEVDDSNERGLGHIALHPDFDNNGFLYVYYTVPGESYNRISRFTVVGNKALPESEKVLLNLDPMQASIHNGGAMVFGFDNYLYVSTGDGGGSWLAEDIKSTAAKVLRMDDKGQPVNDNPWYHVNEGRAKYVYATGLRNPFTMT